MPSSSLPPACCVYSTITSVHSAVWSQIYLSVVIPAICVGLHCREPFPLLPLSLTTSSPKWCHIASWVARSLRPHCSIRDVMGSINHNQMRQVAGGGECGNSARSLAHTPEECYSFSSFSRLYLEVWVEDIACMCMHVCVCTWVCVWVLACVCVYMRVRQVLVCVYLWRPEVNFRSS